MSDLDGGLEDGAAGGVGDTVGSVEAAHYTGPAGTTHDVTPDDACRTMHMR